MADETNGAQAAPAPDTVQDTAPQAQTTQDDGLWGDGQPFDAKTAQSLIEKLRGEVRQLKPLAKTAQEYEKQLKAQKDAELTEVERLKKQLQDASAELEGVKRREMAHKVAERFGLPAVLAERLRGDTEEEMAEDAAQLAKTLPKPAAQLSPTNPGTQAATTETDAQRRARLSGAGASIFDPSAARNSGGGVRG